MQDQNPSFEVEDIFTRTSRSSIPVPHPRFPALLYERKSGCPSCEHRGLFCEELGFCLCHFRGHFKEIIQNDAEPTYLDIAMVKFGKSHMKNYLSKINLHEFCRVLFTDEIDKEIFSNPERAFFEFYYETFGKFFVLSEHLDASKRLSRKAIMILQSLDYSSVAYFCDPDDFDLLREQQIDLSTLLKALERFTDAEIDKFALEILQHGPSVSDEVEIESPYLKLLKKAGDTGWRFAHMEALERVASLMREQTKKKAEDSKDESKRSNNKTRTALSESGTPLKHQISRPMTRTAMLHQDSQIQRPSFGMPPAPSSFTGNPAFQLPPMQSDSTSPCLLQAPSLVMPSEYPQRPLLRQVNRDSNLQLPLMQQISGRGFNQHPQQALPQQSQPVTDEFRLMNRASWKDIKLTDEMIEVLRKAGYKGQPGRIVRISLQSKNAYFFCFATNTFYKLFGVNDNDELVPAYDERDNLSLEHRIVDCTEEMLKFTKSARSASPSMNTT